MTPSTPAPVWSSVTRPAIRPSPCCAEAGLLTEAATISRKAAPSAAARSEREPEVIEDVTLLGYLPVRPDVLVRKPRRIRYATPDSSDHEGVAPETPLLHISVTRKSRILWWAWIAFGDFGSPRSANHDHPRRPLVNRTLRSFQTAALLSVFAAAIATPTLAEEKKKEEPTLSEIVNILHEKGLIDDEEHEALAAKASKEQAKRSWTDRISLFGDLRGRFEWFDYDQDIYTKSTGGRLQDRYRGRYRARLGVNAEVVSRAAVTLAAGERWRRSAQREPDDRQRQRFRQGRVPARPRLRDADPDSEGRAARHRERLSRDRRRQGEEPVRLEAARPRTTCCSTTTSIPRARTCASRAARRRRPLSISRNSDYCFMPSTRARSGGLFGELCLRLGQLEPHC